MDEDQRARIRYQVMSSLRGRPPTLGDRLYDAVALVALPAPHIVRVLVVLAVVVGVVASATVASADSMPDDALYGFKLAGEQVRLALATTPVDRAAVELSMADHRLAEAERLALDGDEIGALVATSTYGEHLAKAAAALAVVERTEPATKPVLEQLKQKLAEQQRRAAEVAARLAADPAAQAVAPVFRTVASVAPAAPSGVTVSEQIAEHAATVAEQLSRAADDLARSGSVPVGEPRAAALPASGAEPVPSEAPRAEAERTPALAGRGEPGARTPEPVRTAPAIGGVRGPGPVRTPETASPPTAAGPAEGAHPISSPPLEAPHMSARPSIDPRHAQLAAERVKLEAQRAREAYERAKEAAKKTAPPRLTPRR